VKAKEKRYFVIAFVGTTALSLDRTQVYESEKEAVAGFMKGRTAATADGAYAIVEIASVKKIAAVTKPTTPKAVDIAAEIKTDPPTTNEPLYTKWIYKPGSAITGWTV
jgi:glycine cleavage system H lipoate-binding protein